MKIRFTTQSGTIYLIDDSDMSWQRESKTHHSGPIRADHGTLLTWPNIQIGQDAHLNDSKVLPGLTHHFVVTTKVIKMEVEK